MVKTAAVLAIALSAAVCLGDAVRAADGPLMVVIYDKARVIHLAKPVRRLIVGNPGIADVSLESPRLLYIFGKAPGETNLIALDDNDRPLLSLSLVVTTGSDRHVAVHVPGADGPVTRDYSCVGNRCLRVPSPEANAAGGGAPAASPSVQPIAQQPQASAFSPVPANPVPPTGR